MTSETRAEIERFAYWHYAFTLQGEETPVARPEYANRHLQRFRYFFEPLVAFFGGSLAGRSILDLGCHSGFWTLRALEAGADFVLAVDGRPENVEQARFVLDASGVERSRYELAVRDVFDLDPDSLGRFDVVLCLGLLYHVCRPFELLSLASALNDDVLVVDTALSTKPGAYFEVRFESTELPINSLRENLVLYPTKKAVAATLRECGYRVGMLEPDFDDYAGAQDYEQEKRRAFLGAKRSNLADAALRFAEIDDFAA